MARTKQTAKKGGPKALRKVLNLIGTIQYRTNNYYTTYNMNDILYRYIKLRCDARSTTLVYTNGLVKPLFGKMGFRISGSREFLNS